jgi:acyl carrier protein
MTIHACEIREQLLRFTTEGLLFGREDVAITDDQSFLDAGLIDSTGVLELVQFLEITFGIQIDDEEMVPENLDSIDRLLAFVSGKVSDLRSVGIRP